MQKYGLILLYSWLGASIAFAANEVNHSIVKAPVSNSQPSSQSMIVSGDHERLTVSIDHPVLTEVEHKKSVQELQDMHLQMPLTGFTAEKMKGSFYEKRDGEMHEAVDMLMPRNTPIHAVCDGEVAKLFDSRCGGTTIYQFDDNKRFLFYYAHLERYADGLQDGAAIKKGAVIGYVGTSGDAPKNTPHLHFSISVSGPKKQWWADTIPIDPYEVFSREK